MFKKWSNNLVIKAKQKDSIFVKILKTIRIFLVISMVIIAIWGMGSLFFEKSIGVVSVGTGEREKIYSGIFFELGGGLENVNFKRRMMLHFVDGKLYQYDYHLVKEWSDIVNVTISPFYIIFVYPVSWVFTKLCIIFGLNMNESSLNNVLIILSTLFMVSLILRLINFYSTWNKKVIEEKKKRIQSKIDEINAKYSKDNSMQSRQMKQQEMHALYSKNKINQASPLYGLVFMPFVFVLFAFVRANYLIKTTELKDPESTKVLFSFSSSIWNSLKSSSFQNWRMYIMSIVYFIILGTKHFLTWYFKSKQRTVIKRVVTKVPQNTIAGFSKGKIIQIVFQVMLIVFFFTLPIGVSIYFTFNLFFEILEKIFFEFLLDKRKKVEVLRKKGIKTSIWRQLFFIKKVK